MVKCICGRIMKETTVKRRLLFFRWTEQKLGCQHCDDKRNKKEVHHAKENNS